MLVSLVVITLFVPCVANLLVMIKERGWKTALSIVAFIIPYAILVGAVVNAVARLAMGAA
jgi:ferrous iron transport protein B